MKHAWLVAAVALVAASACSPTKDAGPPAWAYPVNPPAAPGAAAAPVDPAPRHIAGSNAAYTQAQLRDLSGAPDWRPEEHPPMPEVVAHGRKPGVSACGFCHLPSGDGRPENASLAGLPRDYIVSQMADFKSGARGVAVPKRVPSALMVSIAKAATDAEVAEAADYFSALKPRSFTKVIEADRAPKTHVAAWILVKDAAGGTEPVGNRIIETPDDFEHFEMRDGRTTYLAYVPKGSIAKGEALAAEVRGPEHEPCAACHNSDFRGIGVAPRLAGRSPSYIVRQLYDFRSGVRSGINAEKMKAIAAELSDRDMLRIAAYLASREP